MPTASTERHEPFAAMDLFRAKLRGRVSLPLVGIGVQLADPISSDAMGTVVDFIWYDQVRVQEHSVHCMFTDLA